MKALNRANWNGRKVSVEVAGEEAGEGRRGSGSAEREEENVLSEVPPKSVVTVAATHVPKDRTEHRELTERLKAVTRPTRKKEATSPSREERGYGARGPKKTDDWQQFFKDKEPDFSEEGWARRKPKKK